MRLLLALLVASPPALPATVSGPQRPDPSPGSQAQRAIALYRDEYRHGFRACPALTHADEVVVCATGRSGSADRLPLPDERAPPKWARRPTGEIPSPVEAMNNASASCVSADCPASGAIDLIGAGVKVVQIVRAVVDPEGASDYADDHPLKR